MTTLAKLKSPARRLLASSLIGAALLSAAPAFAQTKIKFQLDWRFEGPAALFLAAKAKGYFDAEKLDVQIDAGNGSGNTVNRVASGAYEMGFADLAALMEFYGNNAAVPGKPQAIMMVYNTTPAAVFSLKKTGIKTPADLVGKKLGAPVFDAGRKAFPIFAKANGIDVSKVNWTAMDPPLRETMLARGDIDAATGFYFTSLLNLNARGVKTEDVNVMQYGDFGVKLYGNAVIVSEDFAKKNPEAVKGFLRAFSKAVKDVLANPDDAIKFVKVRDGIIDSALEAQRLKLAIAGSINTLSARTEGFGQVNGPRLSLMASQVSDAFNLKERIDASKIWNGSFLPSKAELNVLPSK